MARSGSTDYSVTRSTIITQAFKRARIYGPGDTLDSDDEADAVIELNLMIKKDLASGLHLWAIEEGVLPLVLSQEKYQLGGTSGDEATTAADWNKTECETAADSGDGTIDVDSITGIADGDYIGIELDGGDLQWTTVNGDPAGSTVTLTDNLTDDVAVDNHVYSFTTYIERPVRILPDTIRLEGEDGTETPVYMVERSRYMSIPDKSTQGKTNLVYPDRQYTFMDLYTWPTCEDVKDVLLFSFERTLQDMDATANNPDYPIEAVDYLIDGLAARLGRIFGVPESRKKELCALAEISKEEWEDHDTEQGSTYIYPDLS